MAVVTGLNARKLLLVFVLMAGLALNVYSYSRDDVVKLMNDLIYTNSNFSKYALPLVNQSVPLKVKLALFLTSINNVDVVRQQMSTTAYLYMYWIDEYFRWNKSDYNDIQYFGVRQKDIWKPDVALLNGVGKMRALGEEDLLTWVLNWGIVYWMPYEIFESTCSVDVTYFPFDEQNCSIEFGTWMTNKFVVEISLGEFGFDTSLAQKSDEWTIIETSTSVSQTFNFASKIIFSLRLKRIPNYYTSTILLPVILLTLLLLFTFAIPADSGEKMGYSMTVLLSFSVFLTIVSDSFPVTSSTIILSTYLQVLFFMGTSIVLVTGAELRLHHRSDSGNKNKFLVNMVQFSQKLRCKSRSIKQIKVVPSTDDNSTIKDKHDEANKGEDILTWREITDSLDFLLFCFYFILLFVVTLVCILLMVYGN